MKQFTLRRGAAVALSLLTLCLLFAGCQKKEENKDIPIPQVDFKTTTVSQDGFSFAIPDTWEVKENTTGTPATVYAPIGAETGGTSSINVIIKQSEDAVYPSADEMKDALFAEMKTQITALFPDACNYEYAKAEVRAGEVLSAKVDSDADATFVIHQYYPLIDGYVIVITGTDIGDGISPDIDDAASFMLATLQKDAA